MAEEFWWKKAGFFYFLARKSHFVRNVHEAFLKRVDELKLPKGVTVLDAGCGDGNVTFPLERRGYTVTAIDFGDAVLAEGEKARKRLGIKNITFEFGDLNNPLKYADEAFDLVTSLHVLMKVKNCDFAIREFFRVLKPGGHCVLSITSSHETFSHWLWRYCKRNGMVQGLWDVRWLIAWGIPYVLMTKKHERRDEWRWPPEELGRRFAAAGFEVLLTEEVPYQHVGCALGVFKKPGTSK